MFGTFLSTLNKEAENDQIVSKRCFSRRHCDQCIGVIDGQTYPVEDWSLGGLKITGDGRMFGLHQEHNIVMKFKLRNAILDIPHKARVVRKTQSKIAFEFLPLTKHTRNNFQQVVDDYVAQKFADSQVN